MGHTNGYQSYVAHLLDSTTFAIVTLEEHKQAALALFGDKAKKLLYTVEEIKGLEFPNILAYKLLDTKKGHEANGIIRKENIELPKTNQVANRPKNGPGDQELSTFCCRCLEAYPGY